MRGIFMRCDLIRSLRFLACLIGFMCCGLSLHPMASAERMVPTSQTALVGTWALVSLYEEDDGGEELSRWGNNPQGRFIAGSGGEFTFLLIGKDLIFLATNDSERACHALRVCREGMDRKVTGYAGTYSVDEAESALVFKIKDALERSWIGTTPMVSVRVEGDLLHFTSAAGTSPTDAFFAHLVWKRTK